MGVGTVAVFVGTTGDIAGWFLSMMPVSVGDCLLVFTERCLTAGIRQRQQPPAEMRMHDYSDDSPLWSGTSASGYQSAVVVLNIEGASGSRIGKLTENPTVTGAIVCEIRLAQMGTYRLGRRRDRTTVSRLGQPEIICIDNSTWGRHRAPKPPG